jgi:hypothetical protein
MVMLKRLLFVLCVFVLQAHCLAQKGLLQTIDLSDIYRRQQLTNPGANNYSFCIRPVDGSSVDTSRQKGIHITAFAGYTVQNNSHLPYGYNDESLYPAAGLQQRTTAGFRATYKHLTIQLRPEFVAAENATPADLPGGVDYGNYWGRLYFYTINKIDMPSRFGTSPLSRIFPGQSFIKYNIGKISVGISSENIWWGPCMQNSLVMSNNAPGFAHLSLNTNAPIQTKIGSFEAQVIVGKLDSSGIAPPENARLRPLGICNGCYEPKDTMNRYVTGFVVSWQPKWLPNFYIGLDQSSYFYKGSDLKHATLGSMFFRYAMPEDHAEVYGEYGRSNKAANPFTVFGDTIPIGYLLGLRKLFPLNRRNSFIDVSMELTHLSLPDASLILDKNNPFGLPNPATNSWYTNRYIRHGYTNVGQVMGAGIGPGSNSQTIRVNWVNEQKMIGLQFDRVVHNNDFYYYNYFNGIVGGGTTNAYWTDVSVSLFGQWNYKQFLFAGAINYLSALNYKWIKLDNNFAGPSPLSDKTNFQFTFSMMYSMDFLVKTHKTSKNKTSSRTSTPFFKRKWG